jgi:hypothetical protein
MAEETPKGFTDPGNVPEVYADELLIARTRHNHVLLTFGVSRTREKVTVRTKRPHEETVVVSRLVLTPEAFSALHHYLTTALVRRDDVKPVGGNDVN